MRAQKELGNVIGNGKKGESLYGRNIAELYPTVMWKAELAHNKLGYLAEGFFSFLFDAYSKMQEQRDKSREERLKQNLNLMQKSQPIHTAKDAKIRRLTGKCALEKKPRCG